MNWILIGILYAAALICCCMGFMRFVWFMSVGYGFAITGISAAALLYGTIQGNMPISLVLGYLVTGLYGLRLGFFLFRRETKNKAYKQILDAKAGGEPPLFVKIIMWLLMGVIYLCEMAGLEFRQMNHTPANLIFWLGLVLMIVGAGIEALADQQKSAQKAAHPHLPAMQGLYSVVRCPNYFGEILFWFGVFVSGLNAYHGWLQWILAVLGFVCILYIMVDGAKRMEKGHIARYGKDPRYQAYADKTPILFPFVPLYHLVSGNPKKHHG